MKKLLATLGTTTLTAALFAGCNSGGRDMDPFYGPINGVGPLSSALPMSTRAPNYQFASSPVNNTSGSFVNQATAAPGGSGVVVTTEMTRMIATLTGGAAMMNGSLPFRATSMATVANPASGGMMNVFVGMGDTLSNGNGDVFLVGPGGPQSVLDSMASEAYVAPVNTTLLVLTGGEGQPGQAQDLFAGGTVATFSNAIPMRAVPYLNRIYVGATGNSPGGDVARLFRFTNGAVEELAIPFRNPGNTGSRQEFVGMTVITGTTTAVAPSAGFTGQGNQAVFGPGSTGNLQQPMMGMQPSAPAPTSPQTIGQPISLLAVAVGNFDRMTRAGQGGSVLLFDGLQWETLTTLNMNEAPTSLVFADNTLYVGTTAGRLLYRQPDGSWVSEMSLPMVQSVGALVSTPNTFAVGVGAANGAQVLFRSIGSAPMAPAPAPRTPAPAVNPNPATIGTPAPTPGGQTPLPPQMATAPRYLPTIAAILQARCTSCHANNVSPYRLTPQANTQNDFAATVGRTNGGQPAQSLLLQKATGNGHGGGLQLPLNSPDYNTILAWIQGGTPLQ